MAFKVQVDGQQEVRAAFKKASQSSRGRARKKGLQAATIVGADSLRSAIGGGGFTSRGGGLRRKGAVSRRTTPKQGVVGYSKAAYYGRFIDRGTKTIPARHFSRKVEEDEAAIVSAFSGAFFSELKKAFNK